ncbi:MAG: hypothetical protein IT381_10315 [Deltaproteobacteria bacterium]|nr:hypothetical protein [Deltaproteobacteria bacterium]
MRVRPLGIPVLYWLATLLLATLVTCSSLRPASACSPQFWLGTGQIGEVYPVYTAAGALDGAVVTIGAWNNEVGQRVIIEQVDRDTGALIDQGRTIESGYVVSQNEARFSWRPAAPIAGSTAVTLRVTTPVEKKDIDVTKPATWDSLPAGPLLKVTKQKIPVEECTRKIHMSDSCGDGMRCVASRVVGYRILWNTSIWGTTLLPATLATVQLAREDGTIFFDPPLHASTSWAFAAAYIDGADDRTERICGRAVFVDLDDKEQATDWTCVDTETQEPRRPYHAGCQAMDPSPFATLIALVLAWRRYRLSQNRTLSI